MKLESIALHHGYESEKTTKAATTPIYQTSSFTFDNTQHGADLFDLKVEGNQAVQEVIITTAKGNLKGFRFLLSIQQGKKFKNCWMTDAVIPFEIKEA